MFIILYSSPNNFAQSSILIKYEKNEQDKTDTTGFADILVEKVSWLGGTASSDSSSLLQNKKSDVSLCQAC